jgi:hypothetical protein
MQKQCLSTVGTRVPAIATTLSSFAYRGWRPLPPRNLDLDIQPHRNQILSGARRQGARRLLPPHLYRIESASSRWEIMPVHNKRLTSIVGMCEIVCHQRAFEILIF